MIRCGGQEDPNAEGVNVAGSRNARDRRTPVRDCSVPGS